MQFVGALVRCVPSLHAALAEFRHEPARAAQQAYGVAHVRPVPSVSLWKLESTRLILRKVGSASDVIAEDIYVYINPARSTLKAEHGNVGLFANDVSMDLKDEHGERNVGAFEPTCEFVPFTFFYFPMVAMFAKSGLGNKQEIAGDYGDDFKI